MEVATWVGWEEVSVGDTVRREVVLGLDERNAWGRFLEKGKNRWLWCDDVGLLEVGRLGVDRYWRYGRESEVELPMRIKLRDPGAVTFPLEPSNVVEFEVVERKSIVPHVCNILTCCLANFCMMANLKTTGPLCCPRRDASCASQS